jgi:hypothetical protein
MSSTLESGEAAATEQHTFTEKLRLIPEYLRTKQGNPWDRVPRPAELLDAREYLEAERLHKTLLDEGYTMISSRRGRILHRLAADADRLGIEGALVDCGVWNGGSTMLLSAGSPLREVWAFDSFEGLPEPGELDGEKSAGWAGECLGAEDRLREGMARYGSSERLHVVKGWFEDTLARTAPEIGPIAVLHADGDWYESVLLTLRTFYDQIPSGGAVVIDDYGHWIGAQRATDEFRAEVGETAPLQSSDYSGRWWRKS